MCAAGLVANSQKNTEHGRIQANNRGYIRMKSIVVHCIFPVPTIHPSPAGKSSAGGGNVLFPSYRYNQRNFWLEYSTPPTTVFPEEDEYGWDQEEDDYLVSTTPEPSPYFVNGALRNHTVRRVPVGHVVLLDCPVRDLMDYQVSKRGGIIMGRKHANQSHAQNTQRERLITKTLHVPYMCLYERKLRRGKKPGRV